MRKVEQLLHLRKRLGISPTELLIMMDMVSYEEVFFMSIAELAKRTGIARPHVSTAVHKLIRLGLKKEGNGYMVRQFLRDNGVKIKGGRE